MKRDVSWARIIAALLAGSAVFTGAKLAYGLQISKYDIIAFAVALAVVFGLAALILVFRDKVKLKQNISAQEHDAAITKSSNRLQRGWATAVFIMALVALPAHGFGLIDEPVWQRTLFFALAALVVISFLISWRAPNHEGPSEEESTGEPTGNDK